MMPRKQNDFAGRLALSLLGISEDAYNQIAASGNLPAELTGEYSVLHHLHILEAQMQTVMVMHQAIIAMSGIDMDKLEATIKAVLDAREKQEAAASRAPATWHDEKRGADAG